MYNEARSFKVMLFFLFLVAQPFKPRKLINSSKLKQCLIVPTLKCLRIKSVEYYICSKCDLEIVFETIHCHTIVYI